MVSPFDLSIVGNNLNLSFRTRLICLIFSLPALVASHQAVAVPRDAPVPGGVAVLELATALGAPPQVRFNELPQAVVRHRGNWVALVGIPLDTIPGTHEVVVESGKGRQTRMLTIRAKHYPTQNLRIADQKMVTPPPDLEARIEAEAARIAGWKRHFSAEPEPDTRFELPASGPRSARFGVKRVLNGEPRSPHAGLDVAVGVGAPLKSPSPGKVLAVDDLYFTGKTVVIDHGQGVLTLYAHLSRIAVVAGQALRRGEVIGASGVSGRITGPHLHWVVILGGTAVDPELFLRD